jgi:oligosaccharyltransferase complex subunit beta
MLDPYFRTTLAASNGVYTAALQMPDIYGVFKFVVNYSRTGYTNLEVASQVNVHPFRHDEFERFILVAYPYYAAAFSIMVAFFVFGVVFLYHKE